MDFSNSSSDGRRHQSSGSEERLESNLTRNHSGSTLWSASSRGGVEREDSLHSLGSQLPAPKTTRPIQRSSRWSSSSARNLSERSLLSTGTTGSILSAPILEGEDEETMLLVEKLQNEEIMQRVLEQSLTDLSAANGVFSEEIPMYIHEPQISPVLHEESYGFELSRGIDLKIDDDFYEMSPRLTPPPSKRRNPERVASLRRSDRSDNVQVQILDLRSSDRSQRSEGSHRHRRLSCRQIPARTCSSQNVGIQNEIERLHLRDPSEQVIRTDAPSEVHTSWDTSSITSTAVRSLPGAISVASPATVTKTPEVRLAIQRFITQQVDETIPPQIRKESEADCPSSVELEKTQAIDMHGLQQDEPVPKYKYRPALEVDSIDTDETDKKPRAPPLAVQNHVWKPASTANSPHLGNGWPSLSRTKSHATTINESRCMVTSDLAAATEHLSADELKQIEIALRESSMMSNTSPPEAYNDEASDIFDKDHCLSIEEKKAIADALREAEENEIAQRAEDERRSLEVAMMIQREEDQRATLQTVARPRQQGNVRTMSRTEFDSQHRIGPIHVEAYPDNDGNLDEFVSDGFRMNTTDIQRWSRVSKDVVVGPDRLQRTKHDCVLNGKSNAYRLGLDEGLPSISNTAFNSFMKTSRSMNKGVAATGVGRAGRDSGGTKSGALDESARLIASKAINRGVINKLNGVINEGKEAVVYHADAGPESDGFDVAVKVFKRIQEFRGRGEYVYGDPRYKVNFNDVGPREQLEIWADKEFRNLVRANSAGVAVPFPLWTQKNVVFMRFLGHVRPCPQIRDLDLAPGSKRWTVLYENVIDSIGRLYRDARLVHGDLSEYNILAVPDKFINNSESADITPVLIDFAQAVDVRHPEAERYLTRDLDQVLTFFSKQGVDVATTQDVLKGILL